MNTRTNTHLNLKIEFLVNNYYIQLSIEVIVFTMEEFFAPITTILKSRLPGCKHYDVAEIVDYSEDNKLIQIRWVSTNQRVWQPNDKSLFQIQSAKRDRTSVQSYKEEQETKISGMKSNKRLRKDDQSESPVSKNDASESNDDVSGDESLSTTENLATERSRRTNVRKVNYNEKKLGEIIDLSIEKKSNSNSKKSESNKSDLKKLTPVSAKKNKRVIQSDSEEEEFEENDKKKKDDDSEVDFFEELAFIPHESDFEVSENENEESESEVEIIVKKPRHQSNYHKNLYNRDQLKQEVDEITKLSYHSLSVYKNTLKSFIKPKTLLLLKLMNNNELKALTYAKYQPPESSVRVKQPHSISKEYPLRSYQLDGFNWLIQQYNNGINCILADEVRIRIYLIMFVCFITIFD